MERDLKDSLIYAIEVSDSMLAKHVVDDQQTLKSSVQLALEAASESIRTQMINSPNNSIGILFYGVEGHAQNSFMFLEFGPQNSTNVKRLMRLTEDDAYLAETLRPARSSTSLGDVFYLVGTEFQKEKANAFRRMILITDNDSPHSEKRLRDVAKTRSYDLVEKNVTIVPVFISRKDRPFDATKYWEDIYFSPEHAKGSSGKIIPQSIDHLSLKAAVLSRHAPTKVAFHNKLTLGPIEIDVRGYNLFIKRKIPTAHKVFTEGDQQKLATTETKYIVVETGKEAKKEDLTYAYKFGTELVPVTPEQLEELRNFGAPKIKILSFKDEQDYYNIGSMNHAIFLYPHDTFHKGSTRAYASIYNTMLKKKKIAVVSAIIRQNSPPVLGLLFASQSSYYNDHNIQRTPSGLHLVILPYADDLRSQPESFAQVDVPEDLVDSMGDIMERLTMKKGYNARNYENPRIAWFDEVIEATALSLPMPEEPYDGTLPKYNSINTRAGEQIAKFNELLSEHINGKEDVKRQKR